MDDPAIQAKATFLCARPGLSALISTLLYKWHLPYLSTPWIITTIAELSTNIIP
jgi:hypothetical protein